MALKASQALIEKEFPDVYKIVKQLKDCRCTILFKDKPDGQTIKYSFFVSETLYKHSLKELIKNVSKKIKIQDGNKLIEEKPDLNYIYEIIDADNQSFLEKTKEFIFYGKDGKFKPEEIKVMTGK